MPLFGMRPPNLLETIFDQILIGVAVLDADHHIVYANDPALGMFGISRQDFNGSPRLEEFARGYRLFDTSGNEIPFERLPVLRALAGEAVSPHDSKLQLPDGTSKWLHVTTHLFSVMGLSGVLLVATDETREVELRRVSQHVQKVELLCTLAGALAHNFNNIISVINLSAVACLDNNNVAPNVRARLEQISDASRRAGELTKRLAQFSRSQELRRIRLSLNRLIQDSITLIRPVISNNVKLVTDLNPNLPDVDVDPIEIEQVVLNMILNARDALPDTGGVIGVKTHYGDRPEDASVNGNSRQCVHLTVSDNGSGIPEDIVDRIFEPFFTTKPKGTGLGLASAQGIVRQHGGDIKVQSQSGKGTAFTIYLPPSQRGSMS